MHGQTQVKNYHVDSTKEDGIRGAFLPERG
jgi:hypothetical protein